MRTPVFSRLPIVVLLLCLFYWGLPAYAQTKSELQKKRDDLNRQIALTNQLIDQTTSDKSRLQNALVLINKKIALRAEAARTIRSEIGLIDRQIASLRQEINTLEAQQEKLMNDLVKMIRFAQRNQNSYDQLMYLFAADDFYQALRRLRYMQEYNRYRVRLTEMIQRNKAEIQDKLVAMETERASKTALLAEEQAMQQELNRDRQAQQQQIGTFQQEEKRLKAQLKKQQQESEKLNKAIQRIIEEEIRLAKKENKGSDLALTPEAAKLSANFESNRGKLPWPVERGVITGKYGEHPHPVLAGIMVSNNGIDISTTRDAEMRAVFEGTVTSVFTIPGAGMNVIVSHGAYRTVYANMREIYVSKGQKVSVKQPLGIVLTNEEGRTDAHLEIWKITGSSTAKQNPEVWLYKQ